MKNFTETFCDTFYICLSILKPMYKVEVDTVPLHEIIFDRCTAVNAEQI